MVSGRNAAPLSGGASPDGWRPLALANAVERDVEHEGCVYGLRVWTPPTPAPAEGHPVIYVLDGDELFLSFAEAMRRLSRFPQRTGIGAAVIVGISPHLDGDSTDRFRHYTFGPPADAAGVPPGAGWGEGDRLLSFITAVAPDLVRAHVPFNAARVSVYGHSLSAYFALMAAKRHTFHACGAISPSLWWDEEGILDQVQLFANTRVLLACGEKESELADPRRQARAMKRRLDTLEAALRLKQPPGHLASHVFANEDHGSVATVAIPEFLRFCALADA